MPIIDNSEKVENLLNLAVNVPQNERTLSGNLDTGYNKTNNTWEVVIRYNLLLDTSEIREVAYNNRIVFLDSGYAILEILESRLIELARLKSVEYIEMPKEFFFEVENGIATSCINTWRVVSINSIYGEGVIIGILDSGIDYTNKEFIKENGQTKILKLWDMTQENKIVRGEIENSDRKLSPPDGYYVGTEFDESDINYAIQSNSEIILSVDNSGHGTHVAGICTSVAPRADLMVVKLKGLDSSNVNKNGALTTSLMQGLNYLINEAARVSKPIAINISLGNTYGSHDGTSLIETFIDDVARIGRSVIVIGSGNEGAARGHFRGKIEGVGEKNAGLVDIDVASFESNLNIQLWKSYADVFALRLITPSGIKSDVIQADERIYKFNIGNNRINIYYGIPVPYSVFQEIYIDIIPNDEGGYIDSGIWQVEVYSSRIVVGVYDMWLPNNSSLSGNTGFTRPDPDITLTIPSTVARAITVGAYDSRSNTYADFSGRGFTRDERLVKPDIVAPGVDINSSEPGGNQGIRSGTSMAAPFVTGCSALLMSYGIIGGNDIYMYGEKVKAYLIRNAKRVQEVVNYPDRRVGFGALCLYESEI